MYENYFIDTRTRWISYWCDESDGVYKDNQVFGIWDIDEIRFTFAELKESIDLCLEKVRFHFFLEKEQVTRTNYYVDVFGKLGWTETVVRRKPVRIRESDLQDLRIKMEDFVSMIEEDRYLS